MGVPLRQQGNTLVVNTQAQQMNDGLTLFKSYIFESITVARVPAAQQKRVRIKKPPVSQQQHTMVQQQSQLMSMQHMQQPSHMQLSQQNLADQLNDQLNQHITDTVDAVVEGVAHGFIGDSKNQGSKSRIPLNPLLPLSYPIRPVAAVLPSAMQSASVMPTNTGRPMKGNKCNDTWRMVGIFDSEMDMQRERLAQRVSKRKVSNPAYLQELP